MPFAELGPFRPDNTKLLVLSISVFTVLLCKYFTARITINKKALVFRLGLGSLGALISLAELGIAQSERSQIVGFSNSRFRCTTLRAVNRRMP